MNYINGGVCAAKGFTASGIHCGIRKNKSKRDLALIVSGCQASAAAVYTQNLVQGAPIAVTKKNITNGKARAILCNSGNANTCNADGVEIAQSMCSLAAKQLNISAEDVVIASTGVIGQRLDITPIKNGMADLINGLGNNSSLAAEAIMTTDTVIKEIAVSFTLNGVECKIGGIAKGSGMIHPNMATMLVFVTTDVAISPNLLQKALSEDVKTSFNMISVDGDTSTNDMVTLLANGMAGNREITHENDDYKELTKALSLITKHLCRSIAADGEGATKLIECIAEGGNDLDTCCKVAKSVVCSSLFKAAMFGADANWGRVLCAIGYSGANVDIKNIDVTFQSSAGSIMVCQNGAGIQFSEQTAKTILNQKEIQVFINLNQKSATATAWGCDLTYDYVKINGDYRT